MLLVFVQHEKNICEYTEGLLPISYSQWSVLIKSFQHSERNFAHEKMGWSYRASCVRGGEIVADKVKKGFGEVNTTRCM